MKNYYFKTLLLTLMCVLGMSAEAAEPTQSNYVKTTAGGAKWTSGGIWDNEDPLKSVWFWCGDDDKSSRDMNNWQQEMKDPANYAEDGWYTVSPEGDNIAQTTANANRHYRVVMQKVWYTLNVPVYTSVVCKYKITGYCHERTRTSQYKGVELFHWGTTDHTVTQKINTVNGSNEKSGNNNDGNNYLVASKRTYGSSDSEFSVEGLSWSFSNQTGAQAQDFNEYFAMAAFSRGGTVHKGLDAHLAYSDESLTYTYYSTVTFNANGGSGTMEPQSITGVGQSDTTPLSIHAFTKAGMKFKGWNTAADGTGTSYADGAAFNPYNSETKGGYGPVTLYAQWEVINEDIFDANGGVIPTSVSGGLTVAADGKTATCLHVQNQNDFWCINGNIPTYAGKVFLGWFTSANGDEMVYDRYGYAVAGSYWGSTDPVNWHKSLNWKVNHKVVLYARWADLDQSSVETEDLDGKTGQWYNQYYGDATGYTGNKEKTWAGLTDDKVFTFTSYDNVLADVYGDGNKPKTTDANPAYRVGVRPVKYGFAMPKNTKGSVSVQLSAEVEASATQSGGAFADLILFSAADGYKTVTYKMYENERASENITENVILTAKTVDGQKNSASKSDSWTFDNSTGAAQTFYKHFGCLTYSVHNKPNTSGDTPENDAELHSVFSCVPGTMTYTYCAQITYDVNGGTGTFAPQNVENTTTLHAAIPTKDGYKFLGWKDAEGTVYAAGATFNAKNGDANEGRGAVTLTAMYGQIYNGVVFDKRDGTGTVTVDGLVEGEAIGDKLPALVDQTINGVDFKKGVWVGAHQENVTDETIFDPSMAPFTATWLLSVTLKPEYDYYRTFGIESDMDYSAERVAVENGTVKFYTTQGKIQVEGKDYIGFTELGSTDLKFASAEGVLMKGEPTDNTKPVVLTIRTQIGQTATAMHSDNIFLPAPAPAQTENLYALRYDSNSKVYFQKIPADNSADIPYTTAYFEIPGTSQAAKYSCVFFNLGGDVTGVTERVADAETTDNGDVFSVGGYKVGSSYRGMVIKNGRVTIQK